MNKTDIHAEHLNAYVDGELEPSEAAAIARAAADDPVIAAKIATLREMKAAVAEIVPIRDVAPATPARAGLMGAALGVAAALVVCALITGLYLSMPGEKPAALARALQSHHGGWHFSAPGSDARLVAADGGTALPPLDLKAARLSFAGRASFMVSGNPVEHIGYEGTRGCKVSLFVYPEALKLDVAVLSSSLLVRSWTIQGSGFALMADGMDRKRFDGLAAAVEEALRAKRELGPHARQRLAQARRASLPCRA